MQPIENHTPDTCKPERKLCNRVCGILLIYMLLMNLVVVCAVWIGAGIELIRLGKTGYGMEQALRELASHADQLLQNGTGYLVVSGMCLVIILLWKGPAFFRSVFRPAQTMSSSVFLQLLCIFMAAQVLSSLFSTALEALFNLWGLSITEALVQASGMTNSPTMLLYISLVAPVVEELLFRGAVLRSFQPFGKTLCHRFLRLALWSVSRKSRTNSLCFSSWARPGLCGSGIFHFVGDSASFHQQRHIQHAVVPGPHIPNPSAAVLIYRRHRHLRRTQQCNSNLSPQPAPHAASGGTWFLVCSMHHHFTALMPFQRSAQYSSADWILKKGLSQIRIF